MRLPTETFPKTGQEECLGVLSTDLWRERLLASNVLQATGQGLPRSLSCTRAVPAANTAARSPAFCTPVAWDGSGDRTAASEGAQRAMNQGGHHRLNAEPGRLLWGGDI